MSLRQRKIQSLKNLGDFFLEFIINKVNSEVIKKAESNNSWFTNWNIETASKSWGESLNVNDIELWLENYDLVKNPKKIGLILAGNIPFVGLHDILSIWFSGHKALVKLSNKDSYLIPHVIKYLEKQCPETKGQIIFLNKKMNNIDAVIATGSDNTARYFDYYFRRVPKIIRKNKTGVAVIKGDETKKQIELLAYDIIAHYGLGCRNVSKLFIPKNYDLNLIFGGLYKYSNVIESVKYTNNYDYNKAVFLMSEYKFMDNGFFMLKNDSRINSPLASSFYSEYDSLDVLKNSLEMKKNKIQCIISKMKIKNCIGFGEAQKPKLFEYADGINTLDFLKKL